MRADSSSRDRMSGKADQGKGKLKEFVGKITGNKKTRAKGKAEDMKGKVKDTAGRARSR